LIIVIVVMCLYHYNDHRSLSLVSLLNYNYTLVNNIDRLRTVNAAVFWLVSIGRTDVPMVPVVSFSLFITNVIYAN